MRTAPSPATWPALASDADEVVVLSTDSGLIYPETLPTWDDRTKREGW